MEVLFVTGGAGFIGSTLVKYLIKNTNFIIVNIDCLTYAGNLKSLDEVHNSDRHIFYQLNICDKNSILSLFDKYKPIGIFHCAAESHVDNSIANPDTFLSTNILGTYNLLEVVRVYLNKYNNNFKMIHVSTDEVFGELGETGFFNEDSKLDPRSPYSATKASSDLLVLAWIHTYQLPVIITNCTNNYGPYHHIEKLIPNSINKAINNELIPIYGNGHNIRDWLYVEDHVCALFEIYKHGKTGQRYCIGSHNEITNLQLITKVCEILDQIQGKNNKNSYKNLITFVKDRKGHDFRYAIDYSKLHKEINWQPKYKLNDGLLLTIKWYLDNQQWVKSCKKK